MAIVTAATVGARPGNSGPLLLDRGLGSVFGEGEPESRAPTSLPRRTKSCPMPRDVGAPPLRPLERVEPIALPRKRRASRSRRRSTFRGFPPMRRRTCRARTCWARATLTLQARLTNDGELIPNGLVWRLYLGDSGARRTPDADRLVRERHSEVRGPGRVLRPACRLRPCRAREADRVHRREDARGCGPQRRRPAARRDGQRRQADRRRGSPSTSTPTTTRARATAT